MKKNVLTGIAAILFCALACQQTPVSQGDGEKEDNPSWNKLVPIEWDENLATGGEEGVTIEVKKIENQNFVFELRPGPSVMSYRFDVYPLSTLYNFLLEDDMVGKEPWEINEKIREYIYNAEGNGAYTIAYNDAMFKDDPDLFLQWQIDWMSTSYAPASAIAIPDADYLIAVVGCTDDAGIEQGELTLCHLRTTSNPLSGDPTCEQVVNAGYRKYSVEHKPNADCKYIYYTGNTADQFDEYINVFGDRMMRDFVRSVVTAPYDVNNIEDMAYLMDVGETADANIMHATLAVCCDANMTPAETYLRRDFHLNDIPEDIEKAEIEVTVDPSDIAATYFAMTVEMQKSCNTIFYRIYSEDEYKRWQSAGELDILREKIDLRNYGYGAHNPNFLWDNDKEIPVGSAGKIELDVYGSLIPGETYRVGYIGRNGAGQLTDLFFTDPIVMDTRNLDAPKSDIGVVLKLSDPGRTSFDVDITYDPNQVSMVYWQYMTANNNPGLTSSNSWKEWANFIFTPSTTGTGSVESSNLLVNAWPRAMSGHDRQGMTGMDIDTEYTVFYCAEDFDGNISDIKFETIRTMPVVVGPDPQIKWEFHQYGQALYVTSGWSVTFTIMKDVENFKFAHTGSAADLVNYIPGLTQQGFNDLKNSGISYDVIADGLYNWVNELGLLADDDNYAEWDNDNPHIVVCQAYGKNADGSLAVNTYCIICKDGKAQALEEIFGVSK